MARVRTRMPRVFVGHPFGGNFPKKKFRGLFKELPFEVQYGNTDIQTKNLLRLMKENIKKSDYSLFDLTNWNPNVALELGLAEGLKAKPLHSYYILLNTNRSKEVPSDIRGLQRLEYTSLGYLKDTGLGDLLINSILMKESRVKKIHSALSGSAYQEKKFRLALKILAFFREHQKLTSQNLAILKRGTSLHKPHIDEILKILKTQKLVRKSGEVYLLKPNLYPRR